jgi:hypothetical protein
MFKQRLKDIDRFIDAIEGKQTERFVVSRSVSRFAVWPVGDDKFVRL